MDFAIQLKAYVTQIEERLDALTDYDKALPHGITMDAMRYSLLGGGKRIRALLALKFCDSLGGNLEDALNAACAIEMVHAYSLIHDDLPCMDDDELRRGKPTCHIRYGEAVALLAGDALLTKAFEVISSSEYVQRIGAQKALEVVQLLSSAAGAHGMIGGQTIDITSEGTQLTIEQLTLLHRLKTGALIRASVLIGGVLSGCDQHTLVQLDTYAGKIGLAFQITDDILDVTGDAASLGKNTGSDAQNHKTTYVTLLGIEEAQRMCEQLFADAKEILNALALKDDFIMQLTEMLASRKS